MYHFALRLRSCAEQFPHSESGRFIEIRQATSHYDSQQIAHVSRFDSFLHAARLEPVAIREQFSNLD